MDSNTNYHLYSWNTTNCPINMGLEETMNWEPVFTMVQEDISNGRQPKLYSGRLPDDKDIDQYPIATFDLSGIAIHIYRDGTWLYEG